ncbi:MAG: hypothetical protein EXR87_07455 [Gammaproteobacteria bacterium]|nr:hypothetical protein [Gammaproteobacteria bacterium]
MNRLRITEGDLEARDLRFTIVAARFNDFVVEQSPDRAGGKAGNRGADAAEVAIHLATLLKKLGD